MLKHGLHGYKNDLCWEWSKRASLRESAGEQRMSEELKPCPFCGGEARWATTEFENDFQIDCRPR